jgi:alkanesulfonate monooxygenase SsuD/methylene tetrahydromethanopterin reductase-like flavin-dependent oxidoreductase (luciferase family)
MTETGLRGSQPFKIGVFCLNISGGASMTRANGGRLTWDFNQRIAQQVDEWGWDFLLPLGRWRGLGGETNPNGAQFEVMTWAAGLAALTKQITVCSTVQVPIMHPILAAKQAATIDHISSGRYAINLVAGWNGKEFAMFGIEQLPHDERYDAAAEWLTVMQRLWEVGADPNFEGKYYSIEDGYLEPKPLQQPGIPIISAGQSKKGMEFALTRADYIFTSGHNLEEMQKQVDKIDAAKAALGGSSTRLVGHSPVVVADTEAEAKRYWEWAVDELGDFRAAESVARGMIAGGNQSVEINPDVLKEFSRALISGWAGMPLVGTAEQVADQIVKLHAMGMSGAGLTWFDYETGIPQFQAEVVPLLEQAGVRLAVG